MKSVYLCFIVLLFFISCDSGSNSEIGVSGSNEDIASSQFYSDERTSSSSDIENILDSNLSVDSNTSEYVELLDQNKDSNNVLTFLTGNNIIFGTARNKSGYGSSDNIAGSFVFDDSSYSVILFENSVIDMNSNFVMDTEDEILPFRMTTMHGSVVSPLTTILSKGVTEDSLRDFFDYNGSFYKNPLEEDNLFLTKISLFFVQILYENRTSEFVDFMKNYKDTKDLNSIFYNAAEYLLETDSSVKVLSFLIVNDFEKSSDIEKEISLYRGFKKNTLDAVIDLDVDKYYYKIKNLGDTYILYDIFEGYDIDLSDVFKKSDARSLIFDYSTLVAENNVFWNIDYSVDCEKFKFALSGYSLDSTFVDTIGFSGLYEEEDLLCLKYTITDSDKNKKEVKIKLK